MNDGPDNLILGSWREWEDLPEEWKSADPPGAVTKVAIHNRKLLQALRRLIPGDWRKVYRKGIDGTEIHYCEHSSGRVTRVKLKRKN
jgi:hypothetical protein